MVGDQNFAPTIAMKVASKLRNGSISLKKCPDSNRSETDDVFGLDQLKLTLPETPAVLNLNVVRVSITRRATLQRVQNVNLISTKC